MIPTHDTPETHAWPDEKKADAAVQIEEMMKHPGWELLVEAIQSHKTGLHMQLELVSGDVAADYAKVIGEIRGVASLVPTAKLTVQAGLVAAERLKELHRA